MRHIFFLYHPVVIFIYIAAAIACTMMTVHPVFVLVSLVCASVYSIYLNGAGAYLRSVRYASVLLVVITLANPLFNHKGASVLFYIGNNPFTLEALLFGACTGTMLLCVIVWFQCYQKLITNDRFLYLFGRFAPTVAMMVSMVLKWIPVTSYKARSISRAQAALRGNGETTKMQRAKEGMRNTGILMSWSMEDSIETADSMRARGYGSAKRSTFSNYAFGLHDAVSLVVLLALACVSMLVIIQKANRIMFFPTLMRLAMPIYCYIPYVLLLCYPLILEGRERLRWQRSK